MIGSQIQHYRIVERLGRGGMGEVYRAEDVRLGRPVALKFLQPAVQNEPEFRARLLREARAASGLRSPHVAAIYDIGEHDGSIFIVMELVDGELLSERLTRGRLEARDAIDVAMQVADALDEAHGRGIVHRDVKSANLMITPRGLVKVLDFGLAKFVGTQASSQASETGLGATQLGFIVGTILYMSPEQALGRELDHRSDLFSTGVVLYEMLTGHQPFTGSTATEILDRLINKDPLPLRQFTPQIVPELERIVERTLQKDPRYRYQSARELYLDLYNANRSLGVGSAATRDQGGRVTRLVMPEKVVAVMTFSNITGEPADDWIGSGIAETVTADLKSVRGLTVVGRAQIFDALKNLSTDALTRLDERLAIEIGRRVGASWIIGGGYQKLGDVVRITAQFVDVRTGTLLKTVKIDGKIADIFDLQDRIVYELTHDLNLKLDSTEIDAIERDETQSLEAYESYSRGMMNLRMSGRDSLDRAIALFERATTLDPGYASAWAGLGEACQLKGSFLGLRDVIERGVGHLRHAIELNPRLPNSHIWLTSALNGLGRWDEAIAAAREALRLDPINAGGHAVLARAYWVGKGMLDEGIIELEHAVALNPQAGYSYLQLALLYALRGRYDKAETAARYAIELQEQYLSGTEGLLVIGAHTRLGYVRYRQGRYDEAISECERELAFLSTSDHALRDRTAIELNQKLSAAYVRKGDLDEARRYFQRAIKGFDDRLRSGADDPFTRYYVASLYALHGDQERALKHLRDSMSKLPALAAVRAANDPDFDSLRELPEFKRLIEGQVPLASAPTT